ncbi:MAG: hypothetical protein M1812_005497 [Candelaria pacifica]|nr:MAG: hypothetical protein M1812_005497 [Candelaria pacifica]
MTEIEGSDGLRGLYQDLLALAEARLPNVERLWAELEVRIEDFKKLLDKPPKNDRSRQTISSGQIKLDDQEYSINDDFKQATLQLADALDLDELEAARLYHSATADAEELDRSVLESSIITFHERRQFLLECLRLILKQSVEPDSDGPSRDLSKEVVTLILGTKDRPGQNGSPYSRKCASSMLDIEKWLANLNERAHSALILGQAQLPQFTEIMAFQRLSLIRQHESLGAIISYLIKSNHTNVEEFEALLSTTKSLEKYDIILVHYIPALTTSIAQFGSLEGAANLREARALHQKIIANKESDPWNLRYVHAAIIVWWLAEYSGLYLDNPVGSPLQNVDLEIESDDRSKLFAQALSDGAFQFMLSLGAQVKPEEWQDPARLGLTQFLLQDSATLQLDSVACSDHFYHLLMEQLESFSDAFIANMPDALRKLKLEEDEQRKQAQGGLQRAIPGGLVGHQLHLERFLVIISYAFERRPNAAEAFWADPDGNLYGFVQWASMRQSTPRVSAFCEMLQSISGEKECANSAHKFLLEEGPNTAGKFRRSSSLSWAQIFNELQFYASKIRDRPTAPQPALYQAGKPRVDEIDEPESAMMLECYLRLTSHICWQSSMARAWVLEHPAIRLVDILLLLCSSAIPRSLRACALKTVQALLTEKNSQVGEAIWSYLDHWISGHYSSTIPSRTNSAATGPAWTEEIMFESIALGFEEPNAFVGLLQALVAPCSESEGLNDSLPFPESLGSAYRMPGIEPYIDFALGRIFRQKTVEIQDTAQLRILRCTCLHFIVTCLSTFNEDLVVFANSSNVAVDSAIGTSSLAAYARLHPFARVMEWLFNEGVIDALFLVAHQDIGEVSDSSPESPLILGLLRSIEVMGLVLDLQSTYFAIVRPLVKIESSNRRAPVANSALASFEDAILNSLQLVVDLGLYCGTGHQELTIVSLKLLERLSSSRKLVAPSNPGSSQRSNRNKIIGVLEMRDDATRIGASLASEMQVDPREFEQGPESSGFIIKTSILNFLNTCLAALPSQSTIAHLLLGFSSSGNILEVRADGRFAKGLSLFHTILRVVVQYPDEEYGNFLGWLMHIKKSAMQVLKQLWSSQLSSVYTMTELRENTFLSVQMLGLKVIDSSTLWNQRSFNDPQFLNTDSAICFTDFLHQRTSLFEYAATELRLVSQAPTLVSEVVEKLLGAISIADGGRTPSIFALLDFLELEIGGDVAQPNLKYFTGTDLTTCLREGIDGLAAYDLASVGELLALRRTELRKSGSFSNALQEEEAQVEIQDVLLHLHADNQRRALIVARIHALKSWVQLVIIILETAEFEESNTAFILEAFRVIIPKLKKYSTDTTTEAAELAVLAKFLLFNLDLQSSAFESGRAGDAANDRLFELFSICLRGIHSTVTTSFLRETFYVICYRYLTGMTDLFNSNPIVRRHIIQIVKTAGERLVDVVCDDAYAGSETCRISALLLLNALVSLAKQEESQYVIDCLGRANFVGILVDAIQNVSSELRDTSAQDVPLLLSYYEAKLLLLLRISQTRLGATHILNAGLFQSVRESKLVSVDPDLGIEIDNPESLKKYYELLLAVIRVINSVVLSMGPQHERTMKSARTFLTENRSSILSVLKRHARIGGVQVEKSGDLGELVDNFVLLITMTGFLDHPNQSSKHPKDENSRPQGKRKLSQQQSFTSDSSSEPKQKTISELFSPSKIRPPGSEPHTALKGVQQSPASKRTKHNTFALNQSFREEVPKVLPPGKMYNFTSSSPNPGSIIDLTGSPASSPSKPSPSTERRNSTVRVASFTPHTGARKLVVKNLRKTPRVDPDHYFNQVVGQLDSALTAIFNHEKIPHSMEELYRGVENLCRQGRAPALYVRLSQRCKDYVSSSLKEPLLAKASTSKNVDVVRMALGAWSTWNTQLMTIRSIYYYMDRSYLLHSSINPSIHDLALIQYRDHIFQNAGIKPKTLAGICDLISLDRRQELEDHKFLRESIAMLHELAIYTKEFEPMMLAESQAYYDTWAKFESSEQTLATFAARCHLLIERELERCEVFDLDETTRRDILTKLEDTLIQQREGLLTETGGIANLLSTHAVESLEQVYSLLERRRLAVKLKMPFETYIELQGLSIVYDEARENEMVVRLLEFHQRLEIIWKMSFHSHEELGIGLRGAFALFMNKPKRTASAWNTDNLKPGEMIAKYVDMLLRGGVKAVPNSLIGRNGEDVESSLVDGDEDEEVSKQLGHVLDLFRFVHGKAVFEAFYKKDLARRLLMARSASADAERIMLERLKTECGAGFTHNLEQMFKDIDLARDEMVSYKSNQKERHKELAMDLSVNVLSASAWPTYPDVPVNVPLSVQKAIDSFDRHYKLKHSNRKLAWKHALAHCQLKATFPKGNKELVVSSFQAIVMLLFNDMKHGASLSYRHIQAEIGLSDGELKRTLQSLACAKYRVLTKSPKGREVDDDDEFSVNMGFADPKYRIKINQVQLKETKEENKETHERVAQDRQFETQAAIVRIMKTRKKSTHAELVAEIIDATKSRGVLDLADIKKNIEK